METDLRAWQDSLPRCDVCGTDFLLIKDPILRPCGHRIACGTCLWKQNIAGEPIICSQCQQVSIYNPAFDQVVTQLINELAVYFTSPADDSAKIRAIQITHSKLQEYVSQKINGPLSYNQEMQVTDPSYAPIDDEPNPFEVREEQPPPDTQPLPDLSALDLKSVNEVLSTPRWTCAVCKDATNDQSQFRCRTCNRVNFQVYQTHQSHSISLPPSLQALFAPKPKAVAPIIQPLSKPVPQQSVPEKKGDVQLRGINEEKKDPVGNAQERRPEDMSDVQIAKAGKPISDSKSKSPKSKSPSNKTCCRLM